MNYQIHSNPRRCAGIVAVATLLGMLGSQQVSTAAEPGATNAQQKNIVGRSSLIPGLVHRDNDVWKPVMPTSEIYADDLIVALPAGAINSKSKNVRLTLLSDLARISPYPVFESAVVLHDTPLDMDVTIDRGRVDLSNTNRSGDAKVIVRFQKQAVELTLHEKSKVAFELFGRWPSGTKFSVKPNPDETPTLDLVMIVKEGNVDLKAFGKSYAMKAPPGLAFFHWDNVLADGGKTPDFAPQMLESLPSWAKNFVSIPPNALELISVGKAILTRAKEQPGSVEEIFKGLLTEESTPGHRLGVIGLGALDDLPALIDAISTSKIEDVRNSTVIALRHWIGRGEGQDLKLYEALRKKGYSERDAHRFVQLLHSFDNEQKAKPALYETLIELLGSKNPAIRQLANWHLVRLVSKGQDIKFNPVGSDEERQKAIDEWKKLVPAGKLPAKEKTIK